MAFRGFLEPQPTLGERLARASVQGIGAGAQYAEKLLGNRQKAQAKARSDREKIASTAYKNLPRLLKDKSNEETIDKIVKDFSNLIRTTDLTEDEAFSQALERSRISDEKTREESPEEKQFRQSIGRLTKEERESSEYPYGLASFFKKDPLKALASGGIGAIEGPERLSAFLGSTFPPEWFGFEKGSTRTPLSDFLKKKAGIQTLSPQGQSFAESTNVLGGLLPLGEALAALYPLKEAGLVEALPKELPFTSPKKLPFLPSKIAEEEATISPSLAERISKTAPEKATEMRLERLSPKERLFESKKQQEIVQSQLKQYPKYAEEITKDISERAARANRVFGPKALETKSQKIDYYNKQLPDIRKGYEESIARVRALENELALKPELSNKIEPLLDIAQKSLSENEFLLRQTLNNAKTGESRVGFDTMKKAAQEKVLDIEQKISDNLPVELNKRDYNPEFIRQANSLAKKKPLPATRTDDYFTQVHDGYGQVYKNRLAQLDDEIAKLAETRTLGSMYQRLNLQKERDVIKKLIDHVEAENAIHRNKIALREMHQRKLAKERLEKLRPSEGKPEVKKVAQERIWRDRIVKAKTPQERSKVVDEVTEEASKSEPQHKEQFNKEKEKAKDFFSKKKTAEEAYPKADDFIKKSDKKTSGEIKNNLHKLRREWESLKNSMPYFWKSRIGREFLVGVGSAIAADFGKEIGIEVPPGLTAVLVGYGGKEIRGIRALSHYMTRKVLQKVHVERAKQAYQQNDMKKFKEFAPSIQRKAKESLKK